MFNLIVIFYKLNFHHVQRTVYMYIVYSRNTNQYYVRYGYTFELWAIRTT